MIEETLISLSEVPDFLKESGFYLSLDVSCEESISIPTHCTKLDDRFDSDEDLCQFLHAMAFWAPDQLPIAVYQYVATHNCSKLTAELDRVGAFPENSALKMFVNSFPNERLDFAAERGYVELINAILLKVKGTVKVETCCVAARKGKLAALERLVTLFLTPAPVGTSPAQWPTPSQQLSRIQSAACVGGSKECIQYIHNLIQEQITNPPLSVVDKRFSVADVVDIIRLFGNQHGNRHHCHPPHSSTSSPFAALEYVLYSMETEQ